MDFCHKQQPLSEKSLSANCEKNDVLRKRPLALSKWTTCGGSFQHKKETDFANLKKVAFKANSMI